MEGDEEWETGAGTGTTGVVWRSLSIFLQLFLLIALCSIQYHSYVKLALEL